MTVEFRVIVTPAPPRTLSGSIAYLTKHMLSFLTPTRIPATVIIELRRKGKRTASQSKLATTLIRRGRVVPDTATVDPGGGG